MPESPVLDPRRPDDAPVSFTSIDIRADLDDRPYRLPDYETEDRALALLAAELAENPQNMLQKLAETALDLCRADTAGVSLLETHAGAEVFRWEALAGIHAASRNGTMPRNASPCGVCIDQDAMQLMYLPDRLFPALRSDPRFVEALLIPFRYQGQPVGTIWVVMNRFGRHFDREDERLMRTLAAFASAGWQLWRAQEQLRNLPAMLVQAHETERKTLARDLHDSLTQKLVALSMRTSAIAKSLPVAQDAISRQICDLGKKIGSLADGVHRLSHQLHPSMLDDLGLEAALREECSGFSERRHIPVTFHAEAVPGTLPPDIALCMLRLAQESLRNIGKHADAREVTVRLVRDKADLALFIEDSGKGFEVTHARGKGGLGLISMKERVRLVNGEFIIRSRPGIGTEVEVHVPLPERAS